MVNMTVLSKERCIACLILGFESTPQSLLLGVYSLESTPHLKGEVFLKFKRYRKTFPELLFFMTFPPLS